jgi:phosphoribosyl-dephospho-CoA transferase
MLPNPSSLSLKGSLSLNELLFEQEEHGRAKKQTLKKHNSFFSSI